MSRFTTFHAELKRRRVYHVAAAYAAAAFVAAQAAELFLPRLGLPDWTVTLIVILAVAGLPVAILLGWVFDITPSGVRRTPATPNRSIPAPGRWRLTAGVLAACILMITGSLWLSSIAFRNSTAVSSLAVLPLKNLMGGPEQDYFVEGMHEALIAELSKIGELKVISRTSVMRYRDTDTPMARIARELAVDGLIEGSVLRGDDQVRITVQLIHGPSDRHLWAQSYERELGSVLALQSEVARAIAEQIRVRLTPGEKVRLASARSVDPEAYEAYLKGRYFLNRWPAPEHTNCVQHFEQATESGPTYAGAYSGLSACHLLFAWISPPRDVFPRARAAAQRALELDPDQGEAYAVLGNVNLFYEWDWISAEQNLRRALELSPSNAFARGSYSNYLVFLGRFDEAIREAKRAVELDPVSLWMNRNLSFVYSLSRRNEDYEMQSQVTLELAPGDALASFDLAWSFALRGRTEEALAALSSRSVLGDAIVLATLGDRDRALTLIEIATQQRLHGYVDPFWIAVPWAVLGEAGEALSWLEKAYEERSASIVQLRTNPALDSLRSEPRFMELVLRLDYPNSFDEQGAHVPG